MSWLVIGKIRTVDKLTIFTAVALCRFLEIRGRLVRPMSGWGPTPSFPPNATFAHSSLQAVMLEIVPPGKVDMCSREEEGSLKA